MSEAYKFFERMQHNLVSGLNTCCIARIVNVDLQLMKADVVPLFDEDMPIIKNVPIAAQQTGEFVIRLPYKKGDLVLLVFSQRDIDPIMYGGGEPSTRMLGLDDALIVGGINLFTQPLPDGFEKDVLIAKKDFSSRVVLGADGNITIETNGNIFLGDGATEGVPLGNQLKQWLDSHTHPTPNGESGPPTSASPSPSEKVKTV